MNIKSLGMKLSTLLALSVTALFAHGAATVPASNSEVSNDVALNRIERVKSIQSITASTPLYFSRAAQSHNQNICDHSSHYSHGSHRSHSSHYSHRSSY